LLIFSSILAFCAGHAAAQSSTQQPSASATAPAKPHVAPAKKTSKSHRRRSRKGAWKRHGQQAIQPERARIIQEALIREKYLTGEPTGVWDARTQEAMARYQADHGWQSKVTPDSRALIKLGLGPNYSEQEMRQSPLKPGPASAVAANK
jgi:peptidoglycan hydrolase-like protein with peptidoglycan-binding domain